QAWRRTWNKRRSATFGKDRVCCARPKLEAEVCSLRHFLCSPMPFHAHRARLDAGPAVVVAPRPGVRQPIAGSPEAQSRRCAPLQFAVFDTNKTAREDRSLARQKLSSCQLWTAIWFCYSKSGHGAAGEGEPGGMTMTFSILSRRHRCTLA